MKGRMELDWKTDTDLCCFTQTSLVQRIRIKQYIVYACFKFLIVGYIVESVWQKQIPYSRLHSGVWQKQIPYIVEFVGQKQVFVDQAFSVSRILPVFFTQERNWGEWDKKTKTAFRAGGNHSVCWRGYRGKHSGPPLIQQGDYPLPLAHQKEVQWSRFSFSDGNHSWAEAALRVCVEQPHVMFTVNQGDSFQCSLKHAQ